MEDEREPAGVKPHGSGQGGPVVGRRAVVAGGLAALAMAGFAASRHGAVERGVAAVRTDTGRAGRVREGAMTLREAAATSGRTFGFALQGWMLDKDEDLRRIVLDECSDITPETAMKWGVLEPSRGRMNLRDADVLEDFALANGLTMRGHTLLWHGSVPRWAADQIEEFRDWSTISRLFASTIPRYGRSVDRWDVVNEPIETGTRSDGMRENPFMKAFGASYVQRSLEEAQVFAPHAKLFVNEHGMEYEAAFDRERRGHFLKLLEKLLRDGAPLHGVGLEGHLDLRRSDMSDDGLAVFLAEIAGMGLEIAITELDVKEYDFRASVLERDRRIASEVKRYLDVVLDQPAVKSVTTWGVGDRYSWLQDVTPETDDGHLNRGLPFDSDMRPKPMYRAMKAAFLRLPTET